MEIYWFVVRERNSCTTCVGRYNNVELLLRCPFLYTPRRLEMCDGNRYKLSLCTVYIYELFKIVYYVPMYIIIHL